MIIRLRSPTSPFALEVILSSLRDMARSRAHGLVAWSLRHIAQWKLILPASSELGLELERLATSILLHLSKHHDHRVKRNDEFVRKVSKADQVHLTIRACLTTSSGSGPCIVTIGNLSAWK